MMKQLIDQAFADLIARMPDVHNETYAPLHQAVHRNKAMLDDLADKQAELKASPRLSDEGRMTDLRAYAKEKGYDQAIKDRFADIKAARAAAAARLAVLGTKKVDKSDVVGEMQRAEARSILRTMPIGDAILAALNDPAFTDAVVTAAPALSGMRPEERQVVLDQVNARDNAPALAEIARYQAAIDTAEAAVVIANNELTGIFGYNQLTMPNVPGPNAPVSQAA